MFSVILCGCNNTKDTENNYELKESGDSYNHLVYLTTTQDFLSYTEQQEVVLEAFRSSGQDGWIGTGSLVKVDEKY